MRRSEEDGYATPAAAIIATAMAAIAAAFVSMAASQARLARADYDRGEAESRLAGAHNVAVLTIATSLRAPPYRWSLTTLSQTFTVIAEPEFTKLGANAAAELDDQLLSQLGVMAPERLRQRLQAMRNGPTLSWTADASDALGWRDCGPSLISVYGGAVSQPHPIYVEPQSGNEDSRWRAGELWRISIADADGWRDERIVRFSGDGLNPAIVVGRRFTRGRKDTTPCNDIIAGS
jgi:hypothetical protein